MDYAHSWSAISDFGWFLMELGIWQLMTCGCVAILVYTTLDVYERLTSKAAAKGGKNGK